jgi:diguanylate cyclase (GGDEF)-like protein
VLLAAGVLLLAPPLRASLAPLVPAVPYAVFGAALLLAWRFHRPGVALACAALGLSEIALRLLASEAPPTRAIADAVAVLLPLDLAVLLAIPPERFNRRAAAAALGVLAVQSALVTLFTEPPARGLAALVGAAIVPGLPRRIAGLGQPALVACVVALAFAVMRFARRPGAIGGGALCAIIASAAALASGPGTLDATIWLAAAGVVLGVSVIEASHGLSYADPLTGLPARRALEQHLARLASRYAIAMVDVDHFKRVNDDHGHAVGDQVLRMVAASLERPGSGGTAYRYGGEEFALVFPGESVSEVMPALEALRKRIEATPFVLRGADRPVRKPEHPRPRGARRRLRVTVSIGVAGSRARSSAHDVLEAADAALYRAKRAGRNRVSE